VHFRDTFETFAQRPFRAEQDDGVHFLSVDVAHQVEQGNLAAAQRRRVIEVEHAKWTALREYVPAIDRYFPFVSYARL
jgi:hypothetical protein